MLILTRRVGETVVIGNDVTGEWSRNNLFGDLDRLVIGAPRARACMRATRWRTWAAGRATSRSPATKRALRA